MKATIYMILIAAAVASCTNKSETKSIEFEISTQPEAEKQIETSSEVLNNYMKLKDVLVQTDAEAAKKAGSALSESFTNENFGTSLVQAANLIATTEDVEEQRAAFKTITDGLIESIKSNEQEMGVFVQYCPMAFGNTGASWLSLSNEIRNPYFGDKMLKCGRVTEEL